MTAGLETVQRNLIRNLNELDFNRKFLQYHMSGVQFIGRNSKQSENEFFWDRTYLTDWDNLISLSEIFKNTLEY